MKRSFLLLLTLTVFSFLCVKAQTIGVGSRHGEVFRKVDLASGNFPGGGLNRMKDPWEITYGADDALWITEARAYRVMRMDPTTGVKSMVLNLGMGSTFSPTTWRRQFPENQPKFPQGGMMGLGLHPDFMHPTTPKKYVYIAYVHDYLGQNVTYNGEFVNGYLYRTWIVRFTYNGTSLVSPVAICDTLRGSNDHNSGRIIIKKDDDGKSYLYYAVGDMGGGQYDNVDRIVKAQDTLSYEGKILRFNLEPDGDAVASDQWIPNDNPFNVTTPVAKQNAVWANGIRNNQGFAFDSVKNILYGTSHGPFSDDEINIIEKSKNYGHPKVIGYKDDGNYNGAKAGPSNGSLPLIYDEKKYAEDSIESDGYRDPIYSFYASPKGTATSPFWSIQHIYSNSVDSDPGSPGNQLPQGMNGSWFSDGISGSDFYSNSIIPGWKNSLLIGNLKGGKVTRMKLSPDGRSVLTAAPYDTIGLFRSTNRFRDLAISPDGRSIYVVIDSSATTSGPTTGNPLASACNGCVTRYTFLGYNDNGTTSTLPDHISVAAGIENTCENVNGVTINSANNNNTVGLWVPITDTLGNIVGEIYPSGNNLGVVTASVHIYPTDTKEFGGNRNLYLRRTITINVATQPTVGNPVKVRIYLTAAELDLLKNGINTLGVPSNVNTINDVSLYKNGDACGNMTSNPTIVNTTILPIRTASNSYVLQGNNITSFSTFYIANAVMALPLNLISFKGALKDDATQLQWITEREANTKSFLVERSIDSKNFDSIGIISAKNAIGKLTYNFDDLNVRNLSAPVVYYRLKIADIDGQSRFSQVVKVSVSFVTGNIGVRPNPVHSATILDIFTVTAEKVEWTLTDINGKVVMARSVQTRVGDNSVNINLVQLPAGMYYLKVRSNTINQVVKVQKL